MNQPLSAASSCRSVFYGNAASTTTEKYTQVWIKLINQMERGKQVLAGAR